MGAINIMAYLGGIRGEDRESYAAKHEGRHPIAVSIHGPRGRVHGGFNTGHGYGSRGPSGPLDVTGITVYDVLATDEDGNALPFIYIGRARNCQISLQNDAVSKLHAILHKNGEWTVKDDSSNGTALIHYADKVLFTYDRPSETRIQLEKGQKATLEDKVVIEVGGPALGTRLIFFSDPRSEYDYLAGLMKR